MTLVPVQPLVAHWFHRRLALAQGLAASGSGLGGLILSNTTRILLEKLSVKWALIINGCISFVLLLPGLLLLRGRHKAIGARQAPLELKWLWHGGFLWVWLWGVFCSKSSVFFFQVTVALTFLQSCLISSPSIPSLPLPLMVSTLPKPKALPFNPSSPPDK